jgi:anti-anti-sigma factor
VWYESGVGPLTTSVVIHGGDQLPYTLVELSGEADVTDCDALHSVLQAETRKKPGLLVIDLSQLRFLDSSALQAILRTNRELSDDGGLLALVNPRSVVAHILEITEADQIVPVYASVHEATQR